MNTTPSSSLHFAWTVTSGGIAERTFTLGEISGVLRSPESATDGAPLLLMGHGGLHKYAAGLVFQGRRQWRATGLATGSRSPRSTRHGTATGGGPTRISGSTP